MLAERVTQVTDAAVQRVERRLSQLRSAIDRQRDEALAALEQRAQEVETNLRERLREIAADAETERTVLDARLTDLAPEARRARVAGVTFETTFRGKLPEAGFVQYEAKRRGNGE